MAEYNEIYSTDENALVEGTEGNDSIAVYGNHSTVQAMGGVDIISVNGGRHDNGIWLEGDEENFIYAGAGNDSIKVESRGASIYGEGGNDIVRIGRDHTFADGGAGNDYFSVSRYENVTITGGDGKDTIAFQPSSYYSNDGKIGMVITDFLNDDVLQLFDREYYYSYYTGSSHRVITQSVQNGNVVISDNSSISSSGGNTTKKAVEPLFNITLQGVSDISQVANAKYYRYDSDGSTPREYKTFAELFGVSAASTTTSTSTEDTTTSTTTATTSTSTEDTTTSTTATTTTTSTKTTTTTTTEETTTTSVTGGENNNGGTVVNNYNYYGDVYNVNDNNGAVVIGSNVTGGVTNTTNIDNSKNIVISGNTWTYSGGDKVINNYQQGEVVRLDSDYQGIDLNGNSFFVKSSSGSLEIQNSRDKFIGYSASSDEVAVYSYVAGGAGAIDGRDKAQAEIMIGAENSDNQIYAGSGGSSLYGGVGGNDELFGGDGYDEFFYAMGSGNDVVQNASDNDVINLLGVSLSQITYAEVHQSEISIGFTDGGNLKLQGQAATGFMLEGVTYTAERSTGTWHTK